MDCYLSFHERTKAARPAGASKPSTFWVAVLLLDEVLEDDKTEADYLWIKCHQKITISKIVEQYRMRNAVNDDIVLKHNGNILTHETPMKDLDIHGDHVIALEAVRKPEIGSRPSASRLPLQPTVHSLPQLKVEKLTADTAPMEPLNKRLTGTPGYVPTTLHDIAQGATKTYAQKENLAPHYQEAFQQASGSVKVERHEQPVKSRLDNARAVPIKIQPPVPSPVKPEPRDETSEIDFEAQFVDSHDAELAADVKAQFSLQNLVADASLEVLESCVQGGVKFLEELKQPLQDKAESSPDAAQWMQQIERLQKQAVKTKTVIGVVGNTGAGKSSVINAMLDEERLVPTNTMRACTAVVTEISYNDSNYAYRGEIEFITVSDWEKELKVLFDDLLDSNGEVSRDCANDETDAGVAYAKIKAVYPKKTKEDISNSSIKKMLDEVAHVLGQTRTVQEDDSLKFYKQLQRFIDSKEKSAKKDKDKKSQPKEMEYWPLIRVVKIYVKSPVLADGQCIVDLPGVHDANAARAAVAESYMKQCTGLWIVAPIIRAVDDKAAKNLLGETFKRQLKMDGGFDSVTFICSKTDDISLMEASDSLGLDEANSPKWEEIDRLQKTQEFLERELESLRDEKKTFGDVLVGVDDQLEVWEELREKVEKGEIVHPPSQKKKRGPAGNLGPRKKRRISDDDEDGEGGDEDYNDEAESGEESLESEFTDLGPPLTEDEVNSKITGFRNLKKDARRSRMELDEKMKSMRKEITKAEAAESEIEAQISKVCIEGRNTYSKTHIQQDFAAGMKELDQELAAEEDDNFNPDVDARNYDEVARSLPVFCVSSRGYQKLQGRLSKDSDVPGFQTLQETEIPQLQEHCKKLTVAGRTTSCKRFMTNLSQLLGSMTLWASSDGTDGTDAHLTPEQRAKKATILQKCLKNLERGVEKIVATVIGELKEELGDNIFDKYEPAIANAAIKASQACSDWGRPVNREDRASGGYFWSSYKAICRRNGVYSNGQGPHDWNNQLGDPMMKTLAAGWERTFSRRAPVIMQNLTRNASNLIRTYHKEIESRAHTHGNVASFMMLKQQLRVYDDIFKDLAATTKERIINQQKEINREFIPVIAKAMVPGYEACVKENGSGSFKRMKAAMELHVSQERLTMFKDATEEVRARLKAMLREIEETMSNKADEVFVAISRDYSSILGGGDPSQGELMPKWQRLMRRETLALLERSALTFRRIAGLEPMEEETQQDEVHRNELREMLTRDSVKADNIDKESSSLAQQSDDAVQRQTKLEPEASNLDTEMVDADPVVGVHNDPPNWASTNRASAFTAKASSNSSDVPVVHVKTVPPASLKRERSRSTCTPPPAATGLFLPGKRSKSPEKKRAKMEPNIQVKVDSEASDGEGSSDDDSKSEPHTSDNDE